MIEKPKSTEMGVFGMGVHRAVYDSPTLISADRRLKFTDIVPESKDESIEIVQNAPRQICDSVRNVPICQVCQKEMEPKKGHLLPDGGNMVTWLCRDCGRREEINHGRFQGAVKLPW